jgi:hypothetical protein
MEAQTSYFLEDELTKHIQEKFRGMTEDQFDFIMVNPACVYTLKAIYSAEFYEDRAREYFEELENIKLDMI